MAAEDFLACRAAGLEGIAISKWGSLKGGERGEWYLRAWVECGWVFDGVVEGVTGGWMGRKDVLELRGRVLADVRLMADALSQKCKNSLGESG